MILAFIYLSIKINHTMQNSRMLFYDIDLLYNIHQNKEYDDNAIVHLLYISSSDFISPFNFMPEQTNYLICAMDYNSHHTSPHLKSHSVHGIHACMLCYSMPFPIDASLIWKSASFIKF